MFERVFGDAVRLDPAMVAKVRAAKPGERLTVDRNGDGTADEVWYIDDDARHTAKNRPLLVRVIDEDGDLERYKGPDLDSDLYVVDYRADGSVDAVLDYQDNDGDNDVDEMAFYYWSPRHPAFGENALLVWWARDDGDDNLLWYDIDYAYDQDLCQYRCHFGGDETFVAFGLKADGDRWISAWENPFLFYDTDGDQCSEVVLRIEGMDDRVRAIRYSFDADGDAFGQRCHDYDFSITAVAEKDRPVQLPENMVAGMKLRGIPTQRWLRRDVAQQFVTQAPWARVMLTWDEMNANTEADVQRDPHERWEGVIAHGSEHFPQVGGPPCSALNKRYEVSLKPNGPLQLYYDNADHRLHLKGANEGWLHVDYDLDGRVDAKYTYLDEDKDGFLDRRQLDLDGDGRVDFDWGAKGRPARELGLDYAAIAPFYQSLLSETLADSQVFIDAARAAVGDGSSDPAAAFYIEKLSLWMPATGLGKRMRATPCGARFYTDLVRDRMLGRLQVTFGRHEAWREVEAFYAAGDYRAAAEVVGRRFAPSKGGTGGQAASGTRTGHDGSAFGSFVHRVPVRIDNGTGGQRDDWPVTLAVSEIRKAEPGFNPENCAVVAPERWIDWRQIPHQLDRIDEEVGDEISFLVDIPANLSDPWNTWYLYYSPEGKGETVFPRKTGTAEDWVPPNIGWESGRTAYRAYWGQFDFFGKKTDRLIYDDIGATSYHAETEWGIDALHVGKTSGLGGLTLYQGDQAWRVQNPAGEGQVKFTKRVLTRGPVRAAVEITAENVVPDRPDLKVRLCCIIYAERQETEIRATVTGASGEVILAPGLVKLPRETAFAEAESGCYGTWGFQEAAIGEIGLGLIVPPSAVVDVVDLPDERRVRCRTSGGKLRYWLIGDWRRGRQYPIAPTVQNWRREMRELADRLIDDVRVKLDLSSSVQ
jgi:hypothetical protein